MNHFSQRVVTAVVIAALIVLLGLLAWSVVQGLLLLFASILLAIFLRHLSSRLSAHTPLSEGWALTVVILGLMALCGLSLWRLAPQVADQVDQLTRQLPRSLQQLQAYLRSSEPGRSLLSRLVEAPMQLLTQGHVLAQVTKFFSSTVEIIGAVFLLLVTGVYLAVDPDVYLAGLPRLVPPRHRGRAWEIVGRLEALLWWWLLGRIIGMVTVGIFTGVGLALLGVPLALTLGLITAVFDFVPFIGPIVASLLAALLAFVQSPVQALYVLGLFFAVQHVEAWFIIPQVQERAVALPPALIIAGQVLFGSLFGVLGLLIATPLLVVIVVLVQTLYVEDILGDVATPPRRRGSS